MYCLDRRCTDSRVDVRLKAGRACGVFASASSKAAWATLVVDLSVSGKPKKRSDHVSASSVSELRYQ
jgi:hypothetical protein